MAGIPSQKVVSSLSCCVLSSRTVSCLFLPASLSKLMFIIASCLESALFWRVQHAATRGRARDDHLVLLTLLAFRSSSEISPLFTRSVTGSSTHGADCSPTCFAKTGKIPRSSQSPAKSALKMKGIRPTAQEPALQNAACPNNDRPSSGRPPRWT